MESLKIKIWSEALKEWLLSEEISKVAIGYTEYGTFVYFSAWDKHEMVFNSGLFAIDSNTQEKVELFRGDLVKIFPGTKDEQLVEVLFEDGMFTAGGVPLYVHCDPEDFKIPVCQRVGNKFENRELLEKVTA